MSVIGLTRKQPRVFAHDAVALRDLPSCLYNTIDQFTIDPLNSGTGFIVGEQYTAINNDGTESITIEIVSVDNNDGSINSISIVNPLCTNTNLKIGDKLSVVWSIKSNQGVGDGSTAVDFITIDSFNANGSWDYGCPITPIRSPYTSAPSFKNLVDLTCGSCNYKVKPEGSSIYVGYDLSQLTVVMESGTLTTWTNIPAGSFMPVSVLTICEAVAAGPVVDRPTPEELKDYILALF